MKETDIILMAMAVCAVCAIAGGFIFDRMKAKKSSPINTGSFIVGISYGTMISILGALWLLIIPYLYVIINVDDVVILFAGIFYVMTVSMMFFLIMMTVLNVMGEKVICRYK